jgi:chorismate mutase/prephenate dehydratase
MRHLLFFCALALGLFAQDQTELSRALSSSRQRIDNIDDQIVKLLNERASVVREVGVVKTRFHVPASAPGREEQVLRRVSDHARAPLSPEAVRKIYQTVLAEMSAMEDQEMHSHSAK